MDQGAGGIGHAPAEDAPPSPYRFDPAFLHRWRNVAVVVVALTLLAARRASMLVHPVFVLEDGPDFFGVQMNEGFQPFKIYNGGIYVGQRVVALVSSWLPLEAQPHAYYLAAVLLVVVPLAFLLSDRCAPVLGSWRWRAALVLFLVLVPGSTPIQGTLAYLHWWWLAPAVVLLATAPPTSTRAQVVELVALLVFALSGFNAAFALPVAAWGVFRHRDRGSVARGGVLMVGVVIQTWALLVSGRDSGPRSTVDVLSNAPYIVNRWVGASAAFGEQNVLEWWHGWSRAVLLVGGAAFLAVVVVAVVADRRGPSPWWILSAGGLLVAAFYSGPWSAVVAMADGFPVQERYFATVIMVLMVVLFRAAATSPGAIPRAAAIIAISVASIGVISDVKLPQWEFPEGGTTMRDLERCLEERAQDVCEVTAFPVEWHIYVDVDR